MYDLFFVQNICEHAWAMGAVVVVCVQEKLDMHLKVIRIQMKKFVLERRFRDRFALATFQVHFPFTPPL